jgi:hypothetical protein
VFTRRLGLLLSSSEDHSVRLDWVDNIDDRAMRGKKMLICPKLSILLSDVVAFGRTRRDCQARCVLCDRFIACLLRAHEST